MAIKTFKINNKRYNFYTERFDYVMIIDKIRNFKSSIVKVEKEERYLCSKSFKSLPTHIPTV